MSVLLFMSDTVLDRCDAFPMREEIR
jgi:hypothetical protein